MNVLILRRWNSARPWRIGCADPTQTMHSPLDAAVERDGRRAILALSQFLGLEPLAMELANEFAFASREDDACRPQ